MRVLRTIDRPMIATWRPLLRAVLSTCWIRCTWLEVHTTKTRPDASPTTRSSTGPMSRSVATNPGTSALVESLSSRSMPCSPSL